MNIAELFKRMTLGFVLASVPLIGGCGDNTITWQEEVKLLDGRVITVAQKNRVEDGMPREFWLTFKLPEFGNQEIEWHENLLISQKYRRHLDVQRMTVPSSDYF